MNELTPVQQKTASLLKTLESRYILSGELGAQPAFQERVVTRAVEKASSLNKEQRDALGRLYKEELKYLEIPSTNPELGVTNIFESLYERLFDGGTLKDRSCFVEFEGNLVPFSEQAVPMLTRSAFITRVLEEHVRQDEYREHAGTDYHVSIGMIDLHNLRGADFDVDGQQDKPADVLVNKAARAIRLAFEKLGYTDKAKLEAENKSWELGRYGGDEFVFGLFGNFTQEERVAIHKEIQKQLAADSNMSYYQYIDGEGQKVIKKEHILLKEINSHHDVVEVVEFPDDSELFLTERRIMFKEYLERGLLLTKDEFLKITNKYKRNGLLDFALYRHDYPEEKTNYPDYIKTQSERIDYIKKQHPELAFYFDLAEIYDTQEGGRADIRRRILLETVENSLFDRLIGEAIYSRDQFQKYLHEKEFSSVLVVDLKFIKEINEKMTYADADMAIKSVWQMIENSLSPNEREKIMVGRFGGTFALGIRKGMCLADETVRKLKNITNLSLETQDGDFEIPLSTTERITPLDEPDSDVLNDARFVFKSILQENEANFYERLMLDIILEDVMDGSFIRDIRKSDISTIPNDAPLTKRNLYTLFLRGKRKMERLPKLYSAYKFMKNDNNPDEVLNTTFLQSSLMEYAKHNLTFQSIMRMDGQGYDDISLDTIRAAVEKLTSIAIGI